MGDNLVPNGWRIASLTTSAFAPDDPPAMVLGGFA
jgi:hypothetical protein